MKITPRTSIKLPLFVLATEIYFLVVAGVSTIEPTLQQTPPPPPPPPPPILSHASDACNNNAPTEKDGILLVQSQTQSQPPQPLILPDTTSIHTQKADLQGDGLKTLVESRVDTLDRFTEERRRHTEQNEKMLMASTFTVADDYSSSGIQNLGLASETNTMTGSLKPPHFPPSNTKNQIIKKSSSSLSSLTQNHRDPLKGSESMYTASGMQTNRVIHQKEEVMHVERGKKQQILTQPQDNNPQQQQSGVYKEPIGADAYHQYHQYSHGRDLHQEARPVHSNQFPHAPRSQSTKQPLQSLFSRINKSIDALADMDTIVSQRTQRLVKNMSSGGETIAGGISVIMRKTVVDVSEGVTGIRDGLKDGVAGSMNSIFGGAPTSSSESRDEWEDDRRTYASERRRSNIMNWGENGGKNNELAGGPSPLQIHLDSLVSLPSEEDIPDYDSTENIVCGEKDVLHDGGHTDEHSISDIEVKKKKSLDVQIGIYPPIGVQTKGGEMEGRPNRNHIVTMEPKEQSDETIVQRELSMANNPLCTESTIHAGLHQSSTGRESTIDSSNTAILDPSTFFGGGSGDNIVVSSGQKSHFHPSHYDDYEEKRSFTSKIQNTVKSVISMAIKVLSLPRRMSSRRNGMDVSGWSDDEDWDLLSTQRQSGVALKHSSSIHTKSSQLLPVAALLERRKLSSLAVQKATTNLLSSNELRRCILVGEGKALVDVVALGAALFCVHTVIPLIPSSASSLNSPQSWNDGKNSMINISQGILSILSSSDLFDYRATQALIVFLILIFTSRILFDSAVQKLMQEVSNTTISNVIDAQLYLRLLSGLPLNQRESTVISNVAKKQILTVVETARLRSFAVSVIAGLSLFTVSAVRFILSSVYAVLKEIVSLGTLRKWPIQWSNLKTDMKQLIASFGQNIQHLLAEELRTVKTNPILIIPKMSLFIILLVMAFFPTLERNRVKPVLRKDIDTAVTSVEDKASYASFSSSEVVSNMGISSSSRLLLQNNDANIENVLSRFKRMQPSFSSLASQTPLVYNPLIVRKLGYSVFYSMLFLIPPVLLIVFSGEHASSISNVDWDLAIKMGLVLLFTQFISMNAIFSVLESSRDNLHVAFFLEKLEAVIDEVNRSKHNPKAEIQLSPASLSSKGITVCDLWAAYASRRAWACRGSNLSCANGEVVAILGDDSCGKSRLLTTIGETIILPPRNSRSTTIARGSVSIGGVNIVKWNKEQLKRRVGVLLNDVRTSADTSQLFSGLSLEKILEPIDTKPISPVAQEAAVRIAMQMSGLSDTLLPRLKAKLSTIVTANEDELGSLTSQHPFYFLSPAEWSKVVLTKVLAQTIFCNDNPMSSPDSVVNCLLGSILLFDDITLHLSEIEEESLIKALRASGAATLLTSNRWSFGRFVDRIVVVRNGSIIETGVHLDLLSRGKEKSFYAAKWSQMIQGS